MFTALVDFQKALEAQQNVAEALKVYVNNEQLRLKSIQERSTQIIDEVNKYRIDRVAMEKLMSNPVNAFRFIKKNLMNNVKNDIQQRFLQRSNDHRLMDAFEISQPLFPDREDYDGALDALLRLQNTYAIPTYNLSKGHISGSEPSRIELSAEECFEIGRRSMDADYYHYVSWLERAYDLAKERKKGQTRPSEIFMATLLDYLSYGYYKQGRLEKALTTTKEWLTLDSDNRRALENFHYFTSEIKNKLTPGVRLYGDIGSPSEDVAENILPKGRKRYTEYQTYEALCRGEKIFAQKAHENLNCFYYIPHYMYLLKPIQTEEMSVNPRIFLYYDIISDREIESIKELAEPRLNRATVQDPKTGKLVYADYRISKSAWLKTNTSPVTYAINKRIEGLTRLSLETAEELQVVNYGIGGQYEPHFDFARKRETNSFEKAVGNRIATLIYYLSDVEAGGATVFTDIGVSLYPKKGSAAFWYNLYPSGDGDLSTRHAACPVLSGSKWVMNKWFHERGQEFTRPCGRQRIEKDSGVRNYLH